MANILGENRIYFFLITRSPFVSYSISFLLLCFLFLLTYFIFYRPINLKIDRQKFLLMDLKKQQNLYLKITKEIEDLESKNKLYLKSYLSYNSKGAGISDNLSFFFRCMRDNSLICLEFKLKNKLKKLNYKKYYYTTRIVGSFDKILAFLKNLNKTLSYFSFKDIDIQILNDGNLLFFSNIRWIKFLNDNTKI